MANPNVIMFLPRRRLNFDAEIRQSLFCYNSLTEYGLVPIIAHHLSVKTSMYLGETLSSCNWNPPPAPFFFYSEAASLEKMQICSEGNPKQNASVRICQSAQFIVMSNWRVCVRFGLIHQFSSIQILVPLSPIPLCLQFILCNLFTYLNVGHLCPVASYLFLPGVYSLPSF